MGRLSKEIERGATELFEREEGILINISESNEANRVSSLFGKYCDECGNCLASIPVISLGEVDSSLLGSGLFAVGVSGIKDKKECPIVKGIETSSFLIHQG
jgi:hypothetical protein